MKLLGIIIVLFLVTEGLSQTVGWGKWSEWSQCTGCDGTENITAQCTVVGGTGCSLGSRRWRTRGCGGACPVCTNNVVEDGEECDCGRQETCEDNCCDASRCKWKSGIECHSGECCDRTTCQYRSAVNICREGVDECDYNEYCTGTSENCPYDVYKTNKTSCNNNENYCFNGRCQNSDTLCQYLYGEDAMDGSSDCYDYNRGGNLYGNCGETGPLGGKIYSPCDREDVRCGVLQCINADDLLHIPEYSYVSNRWIRITTEEFTTIVCRSVYAINRITDDIVGYANDGTICGNEKVCQQKRCVSLSSISTPACPIGTNGEVCSGQGSCNQNQECVCDTRYSGTTCEITAIDGAWGEWENWGTCSQSCLSGTRSRYRNCDSPTPSTGGSYCIGSYTESGTCDEGSCLEPVNGGWGAWTSFTPCSMTCGGGSMLLYRSCDSPEPQNGGINCVGQPNKVDNCNTQDCPPIDGGWGLWGLWSGCTQECGNGTRTRSRECDTPIPANDGNNCIGDYSKSEDCNTHECAVPVDGMWGEWNDWSSCTATCGDGTITRNRECNNPAPSHGGVDCVGMNTSVQSCNERNCPINGGWGTWGAWGSCSSICGTSDRYRYRQCDTPAPLYEGDNCVGDEYEGETCNGPPCTVPVDGMWGEWNDWSSCTATCGDGIITRYRECDSPAPSHGGVDCVGVANETEDCNIIGCSVEIQWNAWTSWTLCDVTCGISLETRKRERNCEVFTDCLEQESRMCNRIPCVVVQAGGWGEWTEWIGCYQSCDNEQRTRTRECDNPPKGVLGPDCEGNGTETQACYCGGDIDGNWGEWGSWSYCSLPCDGIETRTRRCDNPEPTGSGSNCSGINSESQPCNQENCPVDGGWGNWSGFGDCTQGCGGGVRSRSRECNNPRQANGGLECEGDELDLEDCNQQACVDGSWSEWSDWSVCGQSCNTTEEQTRTRTCDNVEPSGNGSSCLGEDTETQPCNLNGCQECVISNYRVVSTCSLPCGSDSGIAYFARCVISGDINNCNKRMYIDRACRSRWCVEQKNLDLSSQCFIWLNLETLEPQCGTETDMTTSIDRKLYCTQSRLFELSTRDFDLSNIDFSCILHSGNCIKQYN
ncbi:Coadhesin [Oopsacas minuta]|uniref:Coadhesin n=1 Tax=Oopsacas minuta TaxID=111878 RepID=A0AAV7K0C7_9METZ|nr:Coadhesin [Oopsacas minuta]